MSYQDDIFNTFGTNAITAASIRRWKASWRNNKNKNVAVPSYSAAIKICEQLGISKLLYQIWFNNGQAHIIFFKEEHMVLFKLS